MKIKIFSIGLDLNENELLIDEVSSFLEAKEKIIKTAEDNNFIGEWQDDKPIGFLRSNDINIGAKIL